MKILNIGSMNLDYVYNVDHIIMPGETESTDGRNIFLGGKGINQSIALAKAGADVYHAGMIGEDGSAFLDACKEYGVNGQFIKKIDTPTGHTVIQVDQNGQNSILLYGGANRQLTKEFVDEVLSHFEKGDILLLQNEINLLGYIVDRAYDTGLEIALNPSPYNEKMKEVDFTKVSIFLLNEVEGFQITGFEKAEEILGEMKHRFPKAKIVLTLGKKGAFYSDQEETYFQKSFPVKAVDTTAAGDTFTGYFLTGLTEGMQMEQVLEMSAKASSIAVTRPGAAGSIPMREEVMSTW